MLILYVALASLVLVRTLPRVAAYLGAGLRRW
jgi:hypothetical protein